MEFFREQLLLLRDFLGTDYRRTAGWCALGLVISAVLGWGTSLGSPQAADQMIEQFMLAVEEAGVTDESGNLSPLGLMANNWRAMLSPLLMGLVPFAFLPLLSLVSNGCLMGMLIPWLQRRGLGLTVYLAGILPHGVLEIPALVLSAACGVYLCRNMCRMIVGSPKRVPFPELAGDLLRVMLLLVFPLTAAAALLEAYVTPVVMSLCMGI